MMYAKLALENVKKSTKDYLIYIVTLTACISMFYAFLSISSNYYDPNIGAEFNLDILGDGIKYAILLITVLLMFLMQYVNHFMIQRRKREFAIQSIIGMEQSTIARLFFVESLIMGIFSLIVGIGLGGVFSQFITAMLLQITKYGHVELLHYGMPVSIEDAAALAARRTMPYGSQVMYTEEDPTYCLDNLSLIHI